jgi:hypothetical protein
LLNRQGNADKLLKMSSEGEINSALLSELAAMLTEKDIELNAAKEPDQDDKYSKQT